MSHDIKLELIDPDKKQARQYFDEQKLAELASSIKASGQAVSILLRPVGERYTIIHGERRYRAAKMLGWKIIRADVRDISEAEAGWLSLVENLQRDNLSPIEEALAYQKALDSDITQTMLGEKIGKSQSYIAQKLRLLKLSTPIQFYLDKGCISEGHARQLLRLKKVFGDIEADYEFWQENNITADSITPKGAYYVIYGAQPEGTPYWYPVELIKNQTLEDERALLLMESSKVFTDYVIKCSYKIKRWEVVAYWFASLTTDTVASVAALKTAISGWIERFYSAIVYIDSNISPKKYETPSQKIAHRRYWACWGDLRHAGVLGSVLNKDESELILRSYDSVIKDERLTEPSNFQAWSSNYAEIAELTRLLNE